MRKLRALAPLTDLDDFRARVRHLPPVDARAMAACRDREAELTKPAGALGRLEELTAWLAGWQGRHPPRLERVRILVFVGWHEIAARGVSAYPPEVTDQMVANFAAGGAAVNQLARAAGAELRVLPAAPGRPALDFTREPAMDEATLLDALNVGQGAVPDGLDLLAMGEMGIGNTTAAAAVAAALHAEAAALWAGPGTGLDRDGVRRKAELIEDGLARHASAMAGDPPAMLRHLGGPELAAIAGAILAARLRRVPVLLDGFAATVPAAVLEAMAPGASAHCRVGHCSAEPGHRRLLERLGQRPLLDLGMRLGEASGAALAVHIVRAALACHTGMATFAGAGVSRRS